MLFILLCWIALTLIGVTRREANLSPLQKEQVLSLRGICAVEIMIGHIGLATGSTVLYPNGKAGILFVGIFFMLSGYGLSYCFKNKTDYLKHFLTRRTLKLLIPAYLAYMVYILISWLVLNQGTIFDLINLKNFFPVINWYVWEQLFFYLVFWIAYRFLPKWRNVLIGVVSLGTIIIAFVLKIDNPWYGSTMCFLLGIYYYKLNQKELMISLKRKSVLFVFLGIILMLSMITFYVLGNESVLGNPIARNIASLCFCIMILIMLSEVEIGNMASRFLGKCSYEIFLVHPFVQDILKNVMSISIILYAVLVIVISISIAFALNHMMNLLANGKLQ